MSFFVTILQIIQVVSALVMVGLILLQHGKGADMGAAFGSGASGSLFGATGSANFLSRTTAVLATVFFASTLLLALVGSKRTVSPSSGSVLESVVAPGAPAASAPVAAPAVPASGAAQIPGQ